ncbi:helix-turn-helix domain-containing protein, partial [Roseateles sp. P5_E11]
MHQLKGSGLPNVRLVSGYVVEGEGEDRTVAYQDLAGLYKTLARIISCRGADLSAAELRFLRKRLGKSQIEVGQLVGTTDQAVAKWEKGQTPVPTAAARLLRLAWLNQNSRKHVAVALEKMWCAREFVRHGYVLAYEHGVWIDVSDEHELKPIKAEAEKQTWA